MVADTIFLIDLYEEQTMGRPGSASAFLGRNRSTRFRITIVSLGEFATGFVDLRDAREYLRRFPVIRITPECAYECSRVDRELIQTGNRLGENDNWIAGIARYYGEPVVSNDRAFTRVRGLKVHSY
jgi:predicted nucleic acid-binding protein